MIRTLFRTGSALALSLLLTCGPAFALDPVPGQSCSGYTSGAFMRAGGPENAGSYYYMSCTGGVWTNLTSLPSCATNYAPIRNSSGTGWTCYCPGGYGGATTWTQQTGSGTRDWGIWHSISTSDDGTKVVASVDGGKIYRSVDSGVTWAVLANSGIADWNGTASSADGTILATADYNNQIYVSINSGSTWNARDSNRAWTSIDMSSDGTKMAAAVGGSGYIYKSTDTGATWAALTASGLRDWSDVRISDDGTKILASAWSNKVYLSTDGGTSFNALNVDGANGNYQWNGLEMSNDGMIMIAAAHDPDYIYKSTNGGATWTKLTNSGSRAWEEIAMSNDGKVIMGAVSTGNIYMSRDGGTTWTTETSAGSRAWEGLALSADGTKGFAADNGTGYIYTLTGTVCQAPP